MTTSEVGGGGGVLGVQSEADLGMFSTFGRTGAPQVDQKNCQSAAAAIVVCIAARVLNKMSMMTTVRVGPDNEGSPGGRGIHILGASHFFLNRGPAWSKSSPDTFPRPLCRSSLFRRRSRDTRRRTMRPACVRRSPLISSTSIGCVT